MATINIKRVYEKQAKSDGLATHERVIASGCVPQNVANVVDDAQ